MIQKTKTPEFEIEAKWKAGRITRKRFMEILTSIQQNSDLCVQTEYEYVKGPDHYFRNELGYVARVRISSDRKEVTTKARISGSDITKRVEYNLPLADKATDSEIFGALQYLGFTSILSIEKTCDIFSFKQENGVNVQVVYYTVKTEGLPDQSFIEIEPEHGSVRQRTKLLKNWSTLISGELGLKESERVQLSLYEIYTGFKYRFD